MEFQSIYFLSCLFVKTSNLWSTWPGGNYLTSQDFCFLIFKMVVVVKVGDDEIYLIYLLFERAPIWLFHLNLHFNLGK